MFEHHKKESPIISLLGMGGGVGSYAFIRRGVDGYEIARSLRFNSSDSAYLSRVVSSAGNRKTWTWSAWVKRTKSSSGATYQSIFTAGIDGNNNSGILFDNSDRLEIWNVVGNVNVTQKITSQVFRDFSSWYHLVISAASSTLSLYVNGVEVTAWATNNQPGNEDWSFNAATTHYLAKYWDGGSGFPGDFYLADIWFLDGLTPTTAVVNGVTQLTQLGEFDTNGVWQPKAWDGAALTGNSFHLPFSDNSTAAALGTDTSGNGNNWTPNNLSVANQGYAGAIDASNTWAGAFDGNETGTWVQSFYSSSYTETKFIFDTPLSWSSTIRVKALNYSGGGGMKINGTDVTSAITSNGTNNWNNLTSLLGSSGSISSITVYNEGTNYLRLFAVELDSTVVTGVSGTTTLYGVNNDSLVDSPTNGSQEDTGVGGEVVGNYCTANPLNTDSTLSNGNLDITTSASTYSATLGTIGMSSGKWYWEGVWVSGSTIRGFGIGLGNTPRNEYLGSTTSWGYMYTGVKVQPSNTQTAYGSSFTTGDIIGIAFDADAGSLYFYKNGVAQNSGTAAFTGLTSGPYFPITTNQSISSCVATFNFGQRQFSYAAPAGFKALCTTNLTEPTIADGSTVMDVLVFAATNTNNTSITGLNFQPDLVWGKSRTNAYGHQLYDSVRGVNKNLKSNTTNEEGTDTNGVTSFDSNGFTAGVDFNAILGSGNSVAWTWEAGGEPTTDNVAGAGNVPTAGSAKINGANMTTALAGSIPATRLSANTSAGFSVVTYTGVGYSNVDDNFTVGHGLGVKPAMVIVKKRNASGFWPVWHTAFGDPSASGSSTKYIILSSSGEQGSLGAGYLFKDASTSSVFGIGVGAEVNGSGSTFVAYCWTPVEGYSSFGSYTGNGSADGPFVYTGFRPAFVLTKSFSTSSTDWMLFDYKRPEYNVTTGDLRPNLGNDETSTNFDILSNGFKLRNGTGSQNFSGRNYIYAAFAEHPFRSARAR